MPENSPWVNGQTPATAPWESGGDLPQPCLCDAQEPESRLLALQGFRRWNNLPVCYEGGVKLLLDGAPLRANGVEFLIEDLSWTNGLNLPRIQDPWGNGKAAPEGWFASGMLELGIVIFQSRWVGRVDPGLNRVAIQKPDQDILFNVNDKRGTYGDNGGSYDLLLRVLD
ncbi:MAG: hypothetical protein VKK62_08540 [Synechococcaceae cyanobacterium]|nr:hypothetical protein [Synechococcaceae cyanobacterium]